MTCQKEPTVHFWAGKNWTEGEGEKEGAGHDSSVNLDCTISAIDHVGKVESAERITLNCKIP